MQGNGCSRPAGAIDALRLCAGGSVGAAWERMQQASWCYRGAGGSALVLSVQPASGGYRGAGGSVLVAMGAACQRWLWVQHGTDAAGQRWGVFCILLFFILFFVGFSPFS